MTEAATAPLNELNLIHVEIPTVLKAAQNEPYSIPTALHCQNLLAALTELDAVLGPDLDAPATESNPSLIDRATDEAKTAAIGALRHTTEGVVPFRSWVRKLSGVERYSKNVNAAITAGTIRRAFLKETLIKSS